MQTTYGTVHTITEEDAARLLVTQSALGQLSFADACRVVKYMKPKRIKAGGALIREGEKVHNDFMMLILSGDVRVESQSASAVDEVIVTVIGAGHLIGEMGMINDTARSATCIALTELAVGLLSRSSMKKMMNEEADLAARFLLAISSRLADRLRDTTTKLKKFIKLNAMLQSEVYMLMDSQGASKKPLRRSEMPTEAMPLAAQSVALTEGYVRSTAKPSPIPRKA